MAKPRSSATSTEVIAGFTSAQWKQHMDTDEDWTERLEGVDQAAVREVVAALGHADAELRILACNLAYAIGVDGLGPHAGEAVTTLEALAAKDTKPKVRSRARLVHEGLAGDLERAAIRRELPWLGGHSEAAIPAAIAAMDDPRPTVRLQVYLWWSNAKAVPAEAARAVAAKLAAVIDRETDPVTRRAAELARANVAGG